MASSKNSETPVEELTFKEQLDKHAEDTQRGEQTSTIKAVVDKITQYLPSGVPTSHGSNPDGTVDDASGVPPHRPEHDDKIEEFVRDQHRSNDGTEGLDAGKQ